jgi:CheY-like chemotaxis protein
MGRVQDPLSLARARGSKAAGFFEPMHRLSILIADRTPEYCAHVSRWLREHDITCVHSTAEALSATRLLHFDVVVSACLPDDVPGKDAIRSLKQRQPWTRLRRETVPSRPESLLARRAASQRTRKCADHFHPQPGIIFGHEPRRFRDVRIHLHPRQTRDFRFP